MQQRNCVSGVYRDPCTLSACCSLCYILHHAAYLRPQNRSRPTQEPSVPRKYPVAVSPTCVSSVCFSTVRRWVCVGDSIGTCVIRLYTYVFFRVGVLRTQKLYSSLQRLQRYLNFILQSLSFQLASARYVFQLCKKVSA